jgi:hypothetical protein
VAGASGENSLSGESSLVWVGDALVVIEQRALPHAVVTLRIGTVDELIGS